MDSRFCGLPSDAKKIALINTDGYVYTTDDFGVTNPEWAREDLGLTGTILQFAVDPFSPSYVENGTEVNGWIVCNDGIYYLSDIFGTPSIDKQFDFTVDGLNGTEENRNIDVSSCVEGFAVVVTHYQGDGGQSGGTYVCVTTDGSTWVESMITDHIETDGDYDHIPGIYVSSKSPGYAITAAFTQTGSTVNAAPSAYETLDYGATWNPVSGYQLYAGLGSTFVAPWDKNDLDNILYYNYKYTFDGWKQSYALYKNVGGTHTSISPATDVGTRVGRFGISSSPTDSNHIAVIGQKDAPPTQSYGVYVSEDGGESWINRVALSTSPAYKGIVISGDNEDTLYLWGPNGNIAFSETFGASIVAKGVNIPAGAGTFIGIASGDAVVFVEPAHDGEAFCPWTHAGNDNAGTGNPISLRKGEKRLETTDFSVNTPASPMDFTRKYRQSKQDVPEGLEFQFMGLGWTHNHMIQLWLNGTSPDRKAQVLLPNGSILKLYENTANHFMAHKGSSAELDFDSFSGRHMLTAPDGSVWTFGHELTNNNCQVYRLETRAWVNGEVWRYSYASDTVGNPDSHTLVRVDDDYGRGLQFAYIDHSGYYDHGQLWRVGDLAATGLDETNPIGRFVEFAYVQEKDDGQAIINGKALLFEVQDVRGETWAYDYYGQDSGENNDELLNKMIARQSPTVDTTGDGQVDGKLTLESLAYTLTENEISSIAQQRGGGLLSTTLTFDIPNRKETTETIAGLETTHYFDKGMYAGAKNPLDQRSTQTPNTAFRMTQQRDANGNQTELTWSADGSRLNQVQDALHYRTAFKYDAQGRLASSIDAHNRKTIYGYDADRRQPTLVIAGVAPIQVDVKGDMETADPDSGWNNDVGSPTVNERSSLRAYDGTYSRHVEADNGEGIASDTWNVAAGRTYTVVAHVYLVAGKAVKMTVTGSTGFDVISTTRTGQWQTLQATHTPTESESGSHTLRFLAQADDAEFYVDSVEVQVEQELAINGGMEADSGWTAISGAAPQTNARVSTQVDSGDYARHVVADAAGEGIESAAWDLKADQVYVIRARVYPVSGTVTMQVPGAGAFEVSTAGTGAWETLTATHTPSSSATGKHLQLVASGGAAEFYVDRVSVVTSGEIDVKGDMESADPTSGWADVGTPTTTERSNTQVDSGDYARHVVADAAGEGIASAAFNLVANQTYTIRARVYPVDGVGGETVTMRLVDGSSQEIPNTTDTSQGTDGWESLSCVYKPSGDQSNVTLHFLASGGAAEFYVDTVSILLAREWPLNGDMEQDSGWTAISGAEPAGNVRCARVDSGDYVRHVVADATKGIESVAIDLVEGHTYLLMARVYLATDKAVQMSVTGSSGFDVTSTTDTGRWQTLRAVYEIGAGEDGSQKVQFIAQANGADFYLDTVHFFDLGAISDTLQDRVRWQEFAYDRRGRTLAERLVSPVDAALIQEVARSYYASGNGAGLPYQITQTDLDGVNDVITTHTYDEAGRVVRTQRNSTFGSCTVSYTVYDPAGNVVASICNYNPGTRAAPTTAEEAAALYDSGAPDHNHVTTSAYDALGRRVQHTLQAGTAFAHTMLTFYDALGRVWRTIANYAPQGTSAPGDWIWNAGASPPRWEDGSSNPISFGGDNSRNTISDTAYNARGLVRLRRDGPGTVTLYGYDDAGRLVKTVQSAATPGYNNDYTGGSPDPDLSGYTENTSSPDEDIITTSEYDAAGNVIRTTDPLGNATLMVYDALNRAVKTVQAAGDADYDILHDPDLSGYTFSEEPDEDLVTQTVYDALGRVQKTQDAAGSWTLYGYDDLDRQVKVVRHASDPDYNVAGDPDLSAYSESAAPDEDLVSITAYDHQGRVLYTQDTLGAKTWQGYDGFGRQVTTIGHAQGTATDDGVDDPRSAAYVAGVDADADWITRSYYDTDGRVYRTEDVLGHSTLYGYDDLDRQVKVVRHASDPDYNVAGDPDLSAYTASGDPDSDLITQTVYDERGRVARSIDVMGNETRYAYDALGRRVLAVQNFYDDGNVDTDVALWVWDATDGRWEDGSGVPIPRGDDHDRNGIGYTSYDPAGRVRMTRDGRGNETRYAYDALGRRVLAVQNFYDDGNVDTDVALWVWDATDGRWEDGSGVPIPRGDDHDRNGIGFSGYDKSGRVVTTRDVAGIETRYAYDAAGRRITTTANYVDGVYNANAPDEDLTSHTAYDKAGQVVSTTDARGTTTAFAYDGVGRRVLVTEADGTALTTRHYTCYDKGGRVLRDVRNWDGTGSPDEKDGNGDWTFAPTDHGLHNDRNRITAYEYDAAGRRTAVTDAVGNRTASTFFKDGKPKSTTDPEGMETRYVYDRSGRLARVVQGLDVPMLQHIGFLRDGAVWVMEPDGANRLQLTGENPVSNSLFDFSPDGRQIVFQAHPADPYGSYRDIYVIDVDGTNPVNLTNSPTTDDWYPRWSPDGSQIAWVSDTDIWVMDAPDGATKTRLTNNLGNYYDWYPSWSPDGSEIAFLSRRDGGTDEVYKMEADGSSQTRLTTTGVYWEAPSWSPDGATLGYNVDGQIYLMNAADGSGKHRLTTNASDVFPSWSPDGNTIAFVGSNGNGWDLYVIQPNGTNQHQLTTSGDVSNQNRPSWSPDGEHICFYRNGEVWIIDADGAHLTRLTDEGSYPSWSRGLNHPADWEWVADHWEDGNDNALPHGDEHDRQVIVDSAYDPAGRRTQVTDPLGRATVSRYDRLGRRIAHVTNYVPQGSSDPADWVWDTDHWEDGASNNVSHGANGDENAFITKTAYEDLKSGTAYTGQTRTTVTRPDGTQTERDFDRLGRPQRVDYHHAASTPTVTFSYDEAGNREKMTENNGTSDVRVTAFAYDDARRLTQVAFDTDGDGNSNETVAYEYDAGGRRTKLTLPGDLDATYTYDARGRLVSLTDWDDHRAEFTYDHANRPVSTLRANGLRSSYGYDAAGRLQLLRHHQGARTLAHFAYRVDGRGNRTQALEALAHPATANDTVYDYDDESIVYRGAWTVEGDYKKSQQASASLKLLFLGSSIQFTYGTGVNHALFDVYVDGALWRSFDAFAATSGEQTVALDLQGEGPHVFELRNRPTHSPAARADQGYDKAAFVLRFRELRVPDFAYDLRSIEYRYDALSRLLEARYNPGLNVAVPDGDLLRRYQYSYDLAGNRLQEIVTVASSPSTVNYTYNGVNQVSNQGFTYDANGNLTGDGSHTYIWDRANRLLSMGGHTYVYDGLGNRVSQEVSSIVTQYLLDLQPGLVKVLAATTGGNTHRYVYEPRGIFAQEDGAGVWSWPLTDGLGSVRGDTSNSVAVNGVQSYAPYGSEVDGSGTFGSPFSFTGEMMDANDLLYLRARYYAPGLGVFTGLDPVEGDAGQPLSMNRYSYVAGNPTNFVDPSGMIMESPTKWDTCQQTSNDCIEWSDCYSYIPGIGSREAVLSAARVKAACLLCNDTLTDLEKLATLSDFVAARLSGTDDYLEVMTQIILGVSATPVSAFAAITVSGCSGWGRYSNRSQDPDCPENTLPCQTDECRCHTPCPDKPNRYLADTGFHSDFRDAQMEGGGNQVYHVWASIAGVGSAGNFWGERALSTVINWGGLQIGHEGIQGLLSEIGVPPQYGGDPGGSTQDYFLTEMGIMLGRELAAGDIQPGQVGDWLVSHLGPTGGGRWETTDYTIPRITREMFQYPFDNFQQQINPYAPHSPSGTGLFIDIVGDAICGRFNPWCK